MLKPMVRVGLLSNDFDLPAWAAAMLEELAANRHLRLCLAVTKTGGDDPRRESRFAPSGPPDRARALLLGLYRRRLEKKPRLPDAQAPTSIGALLDAIPALSVVARREDRAIALAEADIAAIRGYDLDVLINLGFGRLTGGILAAARCGVWALNASHEPVRPAYADGFWESLEGALVTRCRLWMMADKPAQDRVLYESFSATDDRSVAENRNRCYWKSRVFFARCIERLQRLGAGAFLQQTEAYNRRPVFECEPRRGAPTLAQLLKILAAKSAQKRRRKQAKRRYVEQWRLLYRFSDRFAASLARYQPIVPPADRFWADPHVLARDGRYYVFVEQYRYAEKKGDIAVLTLTEQGFTGEHRTVLSRPYHLSYPFVFEHAGDYYMIPETKENRTVDLYQCTDFPTGWVFRRHLLEDVAAVDATVIFYRDRWWLFTNIGFQDKTSTWDELFVFYADDLFAQQWHPHPRNPVVSDCRKARPAGRLFVEADRLYRVSQNCAPRYGYGFNIHEVTVLDEYAYAEQLVSAVEPDWDPRLLATHTFNRVGALHIVDGLYRRRR